MNVNYPVFDYNKLGQKYSLYRQTDPRIYAFIEKALGDAHFILNVGAGSGSYESQDRFVMAIEPSAEMRSQRLKNNKVPAIIANADNLPFDDNSFDASMALVTIHHWSNIDRGLKELKRVTKGSVIVMTFDPDELHNFWNASYFPELIEVEKRRYPKIDLIQKSLGGSCEVIPIPIPIDCVDGFQEAFYGRPEAFLEKEVRLSQSAWGYLPIDVEDRLVKTLKDDLESGKWDEKYGHYRTQPTFTCALRLIISRNE